MAAGVTVSAIQDAPGAPLPFHCALIVLELDIWLVDEGYEEIEGEVPIRSLDERKGRVPTPQITIEPQDVLAELLGGEVVLGVPRDRPPGGRGETHVHVERPGSRLPGERRNRVAYSAYPLVVI